MEGYRHESSVPEKDDTEEVDIEALTPLEEDGGLVSEYFDTKGNLRGEDVENA